MPSYPYQILNIEPILSKAACFPSLFQKRKAESHKGTYGTLAVIGGAEGMSGAVVLSSTAAIYLGCGKVWAGFNQQQLPFPIIPNRAEIMLATAEKLLQRSDIHTWIIGCGMGLDSHSINLLETILYFTQQPIVLDADALTLLSRSVAIQDKARQHANLILTPHPAEAARLLNQSTAEIQANRISAVNALSQKFNATVVLKGHHSLVATPNHPLYTNQSGNAGLATAGSGDVLSGIIGSLLAQGLSVHEAVCGGVWLHGAAADVLRDSGIGEIGMLAGEIAPAARWLRNHISRL